MTDNLSNSFAVLFKEWYHLNHRSYDDMNDAAHSFLYKFSDLNFEMLDNVDLVSLVNQKVHKN